MANALLYLSDRSPDAMSEQTRHLMTRFVAERPVLFFEKPALNAHAELSVEAAAAMLTAMLEVRGITRPICWFDTPAALSYARDVDAGAIVFDSSRVAPTDAGVSALEEELLRRGMPTTDSASRAPEGLATIVESAVGGPGQ